MFRLFDGNTADEVWCQAAAAFQDAESAKTQASRCGDTIEILHAAFSIRDPRQRWTLSRCPPLNPAFALAEVVWIVRGRNDAGFLNYFNSQLPKYAGDGKTYHGAYGYRLRHHLGIDQFDRAFDVLRHAPESRQVVLQFWDSRVDMPSPEGTPQNSDIPCNITSMLKVRQDALCWTQVMRSNDLFLGLPHNFIQFTALQEVMAGWLNVGLGTYQHLSDSLHIYRKDLALVRSMQKASFVQNTDCLTFAKAESDHWFYELELRIDNVIDQRLQGDDLIQLLDWPLAPAAFKNMLCVIVAEGERRRGNVRLANDAMRLCSNLLFQTLWSRWLARMTAE